MEIETLRLYCLSLPMATEDMAFGEDCVLFRVCDRIFACMNLANPANVAVKSDPAVAIELREEHAQIEPAWHWNKKHWIQFPIEGLLSSDFIESLIRRSYCEVVKKLPKSVRDSYPEISTVC